MALIFELNVKILKVYLLTQNERFVSRLSKVGALQRNRRDRKHYHAAFVDGKKLKQKRTQIKREHMTAVRDRYEAYGQRQVTKGEHSVAAVNYVSR